MWTARCVLIATLTASTAGCGAGGGGDDAGAGAVVDGADAAAGDAAAADGSDADAAAGDGSDAAAVTDAAADVAADADAAAIDAGSSDAGGGDSTVSDAPATDPWACPVAAEPACGGALAGTTWEIVDFCPEDPVAAGALFQHPFGSLDACKPPGGTVHGKLVDTGTIHFTATEIQTDIGGYAATTYTFSTACLAGAKPGLAAAAACTSMSKVDLMTCTFDANADGGAGRCTCDAKVPKEGGPGAMAYSVVGGDTIQTADFQAAYCIQGDRLLMDVKPHIVSWRWWLLRRKD